jgi:L-lactate dehydrogenase
MVEDKGATAFGIGVVAAGICKATLFDQRHIRPSSHYHHDFGGGLSKPGVLRKKRLVRAVPMPSSKGRKVS